MSKYDYIETEWLCSDRTCRHRCHLSDKTWRNNARHPAPIPATLITTSKEEVNDVVWRTRCAARSFHSVFWRSSLFVNSLYSVNSPYGLHSSANARILKISRSSSKTLGRRAWTIFAILSLKHHLDMTKTNHLDMTKTNHLDMTKTNHLDMTKTNHLDMTKQII